MSPPTRPGAEPPFYTFTPTRAGEGVMRPAAAPPREPFFTAAPQVGRVGDGVRLGGEAAPSRSVRRAPRPRQLPPQPPTPSPFAQPDLWDSLTLAGVMFLGTVKVSGDPVGVDLDVTKSSGRDGSRVRDKGAKPAKVKLTLALWDEITWTLWDALLPVIDPRRQVGRRTPVDVAHPALSQRGIGKLYIEAIAFPDVKDSGLVEVVVQAYEFMPPSSRATGRTAQPQTQAQARGIADFRTAFTDIERPPANAPARPSTSAIDP